MAMLPDDEIERIKRDTDLAAVVRSRGVALAAQGGDLVGLCPFHDDKSPSLHVTPAKRLWRCVSCQATGNVIQFVQKFDGVSFRHAYELLKNGAAFTGAPTCAPVKKATVPKLPAPVTADADDQAALRQVLDYYHERLRENPPALAYLKKRGVTAEAVAAFRVGFVDRTLGLRLPQKNRAEGAALRARLARLGVLRDTGHEHLRGRVVFPVVAESGEIGTVYGRAIDDGGKHDRHLFLPGPMRGIWNPAALRSPEVILCEGIIDALTFWGAGFRNVTTTYSAKALPEELLAALVAARVRRVFVAFDRDEAGDCGAADVASQLSEYGIEAARVLFPHGQDANAYALAVQPADKALGVLLRAAVPLAEIGPKASKPEVSPEVSADVAATTPRHEGGGTLPPAPAPSSLAAKAALKAAAPACDGPTAPAVPPTPKPAAREETFEPVAPSSGTPTPAASAPSPTAEPTAPTSTPPPTIPATATPSPASAVSLVVVAKNDGDEIVLALGDRVWTVRGLAKNTGFESLKVTLRVACAERWHLDNLDLCVARQRAAFIDAAASETALRPELVKRDLGHVLRKLEELQEARLKAEAAPKATAPTMSETERAAALAFLRDPKLLDRILSDFDACGVVGEEINKLVGYLAAVSRLMDRPLAVIIQSSSAAGKTTLMDAILSFMPPEIRIKYSAMTGQSLFYMGGLDLRHKILAIVEEEGAEKASYALKLLQSEGELSIASAGKDPGTGRMETQEYHVEGPTQLFLTTTAADMDEELQNRAIVLTVDESREQTERIHALQREARTEAGLIRKARRKQVLALHHAAQRLLAPLPVFNPYAPRLRFLSSQLRTRRDHEKYLLLIDTVTLLFQHQRARKPIEGRGDCIITTLDDIAVANRLAHHVLGRGLDEMPPQTRRLLGLIYRFIAERAKASGLERDAIRFRARDLRDFTGMGQSQLHVHLSRLVELEYVVTHRADHGQGTVYELLHDTDPETQGGAKLLTGLLDVEKLRAEEAAKTHDYDAKLPGVNGELPAPFRPCSGPIPGVFRPTENGTNPPQSGDLRKPEPENGGNA